MRHAADKMMMTTMTKMMTMMMTMMMTTMMTMMMTMMMTKMMTAPAARALAVQPSVPLKALPTRCLEDSAAFQRPARAHHQPTTTRTRPQLQSCAAAADSTFWAQTTIQSRSRTCHWTQKWWGCHTCDRQRVSNHGREEHTCARGAHLRLRMETVAEIWRFASWFMTLLHSPLFFFIFQSDNRCSAPFSLWSISAS